ncbi:MAG TPA: cytochrome c [Cyclobacteriaceae bacterium]|nr:cytochrome c [Cyclobacteriaceae bacterium]
MNRWSLMFIASFLIWGCGPGGKSRDSKFQQYLVQGEELYLKHCSNCHQKSGKGLGLLYPPLDQSDFMDQNLDSVICLIKNGRSGEILVNGKKYNQPMPGVPLLSDLEIAEITTYIYNTWTHDKGIIEVNQVTSILEKCATRQ